MTDKKYTLDWRWDMSYAVVKGTPSGWELRCDPKRLDGDIVLHLTALFDGRKYGRHTISTGGIDDIDDYDKVLNNNPDAVETAIGNGIEALQQHLNAAKQILGMTAA